MSESAGPIGSASGSAPAAPRWPAAGLQSSAAVTAGLAVLAPLQEVYSIRWDIGEAVQTFRVTGWGATQHFPGQADVAVPTTRIAITFLVGAVLLTAGALARSAPRWRPLAPMAVLAGAAVTAGAALTVFLDYRAAVAQTASTPPEVVTAVTVHAGGWLVGVAGATAVATALLACWTARPVPAPAPTAPAPAPAEVAAADPAPPDQESPRTLPAWSPADFQRPRPGAEAG